MKGPEARLRKKILIALEAKYPQALFLKIYGSQFQQAGIPDIIGCLNGVFIGIEVKLPGGHPTQIQELMIDLIQKAKGVSGAATTVQEALDLAAKCLDL